MADSPEEVDCERLDITVLLVDDDTATLSTNAGILRSWQYKVATATSGHKALKTLGKFKGFFDLVITDLNIRGMNGFELQKRVKCEFHLPVIIMSADGRKSVMSKSLEYGAAHYILKPVRREDLKDVWQYAVAGRREKLTIQNDKIVSVSEEGDSSSSSPGAEKSIHNSAVRGTTTSPKKQRKKYCKRKRSEVIDNEELIFCGQKRSKIFWTTNLHNRFLLALNHIGMDKVVPTKILEIMNVPGLTRENVASHLQKYRMFLKKVADKGILEGLSERTLRSRFAMGLPTDLIRDLQKRVNSFRLHENYYHQPYNTVVSRPPTTLPSLANQTRLVQPNHYRTNHTYRNFQQSHYHDQANHHHHPIVNGGFTTSANALTANGLMSHYSLLGNNKNFNYVPPNYDNNNNHGMIVPYGSSGMQRSPWTYNHHGTQLNNNNNNHGMIVPYGSSSLHRSPSTYNNPRRTQLNNNASLTLGALNRVQNICYAGDNSNYNYNSSSNNIFGLLSNGSASNNAIVPVSSSVVNVCVEPNRANISAGFSSLPQQSINGIRNTGGGDHNQHNTVTSVNQREAGQMDDLNELFLMIEDMVLPNETAENPRAGERSSSNILSCFNVEDYIEPGDGDHVNAQTSERSINVLPNMSSSCANENPNMVMRNDASTNLELLNMFVADKANSPSENSTSLEQTSHLDWDMDLLETLFGAAYPNQK